MLHIFQIMFNFIVEQCITCILIPSVLIFVFNRRAKDKLNLIDLALKHSSSQGYVLPDLDEARFVHDKSFHEIVFFALEMPGIRHQYSIREKFSLSGPIGSTKIDIKELE